LQNSEIVSVNPVVPERAPLTTSAEVGAVLIASAPDPVVADPVVADPVVADPAPLTTSAEVGAVLMAPAPDPVVANEPGRGSYHLEVTLMYGSKGHFLRDFP